MSEQRVARGNCPTLFLIDLAESQGVKKAICKLNSY